MLCPVCGTYATDDEIVCQRCGKLLERVHSEDEELLNFRQGRHLRTEQTVPAPSVVQPGGSGASRAFEDTRPPETPEATGAIYGQQDVLSDTGHIYGLGPDVPLAPQTSSRPTVMRAHERTSRANRLLRRRKMVNWAYVIIACIVLVFAAIIGAFLWMRNTDSGQRFVARTGLDVKSESLFPTGSQALWQVGEEYLNTGDVERAVDYFVRAREKDGEDAPNASGLLLLGDAYERMENMEMAEEVYAYVYTEVVPSAPEAYDNQVRLLLELGRDAEAAVLLQTAYSQTRLERFRTQRSEVLPELPYASVIAGYYTEKKTITLLQDQDYSIIYTTDQFAVLPEEGVEYTGPFELGEGEHKLRAVAVYGDLVSDEMEATYQIYMPTPLQPDANLAPATYERARTVSLRPGKLSDEQLEKNPGYAETLDDPVAQDITIYYTIDGSMPDANSPIFDGTPIQLPAGYVTLRAVSVNGYDKEGNMLEVTYKFNIKPALKQIYSPTDVIGKLALGTTSREAFHSTYGAGNGMETVWINGVQGECEKYTYSWGHAAFMKIKSGWVLAELYFTDSTFSGPRSTGIGMTEKQVTEKFKDFGQVVGATGRKRGLYQDEDEYDKSGVIYIKESGERTIIYRTPTADGHVWQLTYSLNASGVVTSIRWLYEH